MSIGQNLYYYRAKVISVYDGDTFRADVDLGMSATMMNQQFRLADIDTPEVRGEEKEDGLIVGEYVNKLILGKEIIINTMKTGKFGRWIAWVFLPEIKGETINEHLLRIGYASPYGQKWTGFIN